MQYFQSLIKEEIQNRYSEFEVVFTTVPNIETGHISIPCFNFSKLLRKPPYDIAGELAEIL